MTNEYTPEKIERANSPELDAILGVDFPVLDHGFVRVIDYMGNEAAVAQMARVSYGKGTKSVNEDKGLLRYLLRHKHTSPFEGCEIKLHIKMPIFVMRQWIRHRTANVNEYSMRYSEPKDQFYIPDLEQIKLQSTDNKQGRGADADSKTKHDFIEASSFVASNAMTQYDWFNEQGVARELNRINLPVSAYTECYWKIDLHNLLHFLNLRLNPHAQYEIRVFAEEIFKILQIWVPNIADAFVDYTLEAQTFSKQEWAIIKQMITQDKTALQFIETRLENNGLSKREAAEFIKKIGKDND